MQLTDCTDNNYELKDAAVVPNGQRILLDQWIETQGMTIIVMNVAVVPKPKFHHL